jgi:hypothetical protein
MARKKHRKQRGAKVSQPKAEAIVARLLASTAGLQFGSVSVTAKVHNGRVTEITYSTTENTREAQKKEADTEVTDNQ